MSYKNIPKKRKVYVDDNQVLYPLGLKADAVDMNYEPADIAAYGTVTIEAGTSTVSGVGTWFNYEFVGGLIKIGDEIHTIASITDRYIITLEDNHIAGADGLPYYTESKNTVLGAGALSSEAKWDTTAVGYLALANTVDETNCSAFGAGALMNNTGGYNSSFGWRSMLTDVTGFGNAAFGDRALSLQTGSNYNTAFGSLAMALGDPGEANTAVGRSALKYNDGATNNVAVGRSTCLNVTGNGNTGLGKDALHENVTGDGNVAIGYGAGFNEMGSHQLYISDGTVVSGTLLRGDFSTQNLGLCGATDYQDGEKVVAMENAITVPTTNPTGGGIMYVEGGALKWRGSSGTVTEIAPA